MATPSFVGTIVSDEQKTSTSSWNVAVTANHGIAGRGAIATIGADNPAVTTGNQDTSFHSSLTDSKGNTWIKVWERSSSGNIGGAATCSQWRCEEIVASLTTSDTFTVAFSTTHASAPAMVLIVEVFATPIELVDFATDHGSGGAVSLTVGSLPSAEYLAYRSGAHEQANQAFTPTSGWTAGAVNGTSGSGAGTNICVKPEYDIETTTTFTSAPSAGSTNNAGVLGIYQEKVTATEPEILLDVAIVHVAALDPSLDAEPTLDADSAVTTVRAPTPTFETDSGEPELLLDVARTHVTSPSPTLDIEPTLDILGGEVRSTSFDVEFVAEESEPVLQLDLARTHITTPDLDLAAEPTLELDTARAQITAPDPLLDTEPTLDTDTARTHIATPIPSLDAEPTLDLDLARTQTTAYPPDLTSDLTLDRALTHTTAPSPTFDAEPVLDLDVAHVHITIPDPSLDAEPTLDLDTATTRTITPTPDLLPAHALDLDIARAHITTPLPTFEPDTPTEAILDLDLARTTTRAPTPLLAPEPALDLDIARTRVYAYPYLSGQVMELDCAYTVTRAFDPLFIITPIVITTIGGARSYDPVDRRTYDEAQRTYRDDL